MRLYPIILGICVCGTVVFAQNGTLSGTKTRDQLFTKVGESGIKATEFSPDVVTLVDDTGWQQVLRNGGLTLDQPSQNEFIYNARLNAERLNLPERDWDAIAKMGLPHFFSTAVLNMQFELSQPWSDRAFGDRAIQRIDLQNLNLALADMTLTAKGAVNFDDDAQMQGEISAYVTNWRDVVGLLDFPSPTQKKLTEAFLEGLADGNAVEVTFDIVDSQLMLGPIPLTKIPSILPK
ncbi:hypothetical protein GCM10008927_21870 [Amylibacter ulvae]|uniref:Uncharacterized protein n=1 Tax=Paramylibacter ulvae TaxID=1651968 RepID=A0ABQ3D3E2_9RHOB|nr:DUF2125 domain-containing protein [Amylibacter ulvae]GHA55780.1 hypothetical protein GCM10008927_21870 [Amylibacter ulvae]